MDRKKVGIIGFGRTGEGLFSFLLDDPGVSDIMIFDDKNIDRERLPSGYANMGVELLSGEEGIKKLSGSDLVIFSPGVNGRDERFFPIRESGVKIVSEMEFASSLIDSEIIAVTGTNGKSTTVSLIHHILDRSGIDSRLTGNIGVPLISEVKRISDKSVIVLEVSSFQLEEIEDFKPGITMILNVTPDHLDRYPTLFEYREAKLNILKNLSENDPVILNYDDPFLRKTFYGRDKFNFRKIWFSVEESGFNEGGWITDNQAILKINGKEQEISLEGNPLIGSHNIENILASFLAVSLTGLYVGDLSEALKSFTGLPHRMEVCGEKKGVRFINDSKATNVEATLKSITGIEDDIALILGGKDKGGDFSVLKEYLNRKIKKIILIGESAATIAAGINSEKTFFTRANTLDEALRKGYEVLAGNGGTVLLAPGCASFDMFKNYEERGDVFKNDVRKFIEEG